MTAHELGQLRQCVNSCNQYREWKFIGCGWRVAITQFKYFAVYAHALSKT